MRGFSAVERAATLLRDPMCIARMRAEPLPGDVTVVLRILAGDAEAEANASLAINKPTATVREAAEFYVNQVLLHASADAYRLLGVRPDASRSELRSNLALLLRWLHPDIAGEEHRATAERVIKAWHELKSPDSREALDQVLANKEAERRRRVKSASRLSSPGRASLRRTPPQKNTRRGRGSPRKLMIVVASLAAMAIFGAYLPIEPPADVYHYLDSLAQYASTIPTLLLRSQSSDGSVVAGGIPNALHSRCAKCSPVEKVELRP